LTIKTRPLNSDDEVQWRKLWGDYLAFYETTAPEPVYQTTFSRLLDPNRPQQFCVVAEKESNLIGLVHAIYHAHNWRIEDVCYLQDLYVIPEARSTGAGRALIEAVYAAADDNGTPSVYWLTQDFNHDARKLYDNIANLTPFIKYSR